MIINLLKTKKEDFCKEYNKIKKKLKKYGLNLNLTENDFKNEKFDINDDFFDQQESFWKEIINYKSILLFGKQGSGKSYFVKKLHNYLIKENTNYKISWIKTWDYDYENNPILLLMKKVLLANVLQENDQKNYIC